MTYLLGRVMQWLRVPGFIRPFWYGESGHVISARTSPRYTILAIDGQEFFFIRETGKFDGVGAMSLELPTYEQVMCEVEVDKA